MRSMLGKYREPRERTRWPGRCFVVITIPRRPGTAQGLAEKGRIPYGIVRMSHGPLNVYLHIADYIYNYNYKYMTGISYGKRRQVGDDYIYPIPTAPGYRTAGPSVKSDLSHLSPLESIFILN